MLRDRNVKAIRFLQEALEFFQRCLSLQEYQLTQPDECDSDSAKHREDTADGDAPMGKTTGSETVEGEVWAYVAEPVTKDALIDTILAQLETLTTICSLNNFQAGDNIGWIEEYFRNTINDKITYLTRDTGRTQEANIAKAKFIAAFADISLRHGQLDIPEYERELAEAFYSDLDLTRDARGLCERAEAEITFQASIYSLGLRRQISQSDMARLNETRWRHISKALGDLTAASRLPLVDNLPRIHLRRGDCELLRYQTGQGPNPYEPAMKSSQILMKNAEVYYRGAAGLARNRSAESEEQEASVKQALVASLIGDPQKLLLLPLEYKQALMETIDDMREEGLLSGEDIAKL